MTDFYRKTVYWWPAIMRAFLYTLTTMFSAFIIQTDKLSSATTLDWSWMEWMRFWLPILAAGMGTIIAFLDQTMGKLRNEETSAWKAGESI